MKNILLRYILKEIRQDTGEDIPDDVDDETFGKEEKPDPDVRLPKDVKQTASPAKKDISSDPDYKRGAREKPLKMVDKPEHEKEKDQFVADKQPGELDKLSDKNLGTFKPSGEVRTKNIKVGVSVIESNKNLTLEMSIDFNLIANNEFVKRFMSQYDDMEYRQKEVEMLEKVILKNDDWFEYDEVVEKLKDVIDDIKSYNDPNLNKAADLLYILASNSTELDQNEIKDTFAKVNVAMQAYTSSDESAKKKSIKYGKFYYEKAIHEIERIYGRNATKERIDVLKRKVDSNPMFKNQYIFDWAEPAIVYQNENSLRKFFSKPSSFGDSKSHGIGYVLRFKLPRAIKNQKDYYRYVAAKVEEMMKEIAKLPEYQSSEYFTLKP